MADPIDLGPPRILGRHAGDLRGTYGHERFGAPVAHPHWMADERLAFLRAVETGDERGILGASDAVREAAASAGEIEVPGGREVRLTAEGRRAIAQAKEAPEGSARDEYRAALAMTEEARLDLRRAGERQQRAYLAMLREEHPCPCVRLNSELGIADSRAQAHAQRRGIGLGLVAETLSADARCPLCGGSGVPRVEQGSGAADGPRGDTGGAVAAGFGSLMVPTAQGTAEGLERS